MTKFEPGKTYPLRGGGVGIENKRCSDFDEDCQDVKDPLTCWVGGTFLSANGETVCLPISDGYCPLLRSEATNPTLSTKKG